jgi:phospholipase/carboxylesterase
VKIEQIAGLNTRIVGPDAKHTVILLHGFGAPGDDLVSLADYLKVPARFVFPEAPLELGGMYDNARAWWMIDLARLQNLKATDRSAEIPDGLSASRDKVSSLVDHFATTSDRVVLGGFSQGAMLSLDVALHSAQKLAGVVMMSGTLIAEPEWSPLMQKLAGTRVFQSHGQYDQLLPFVVAEKLRDKLKTAGALVDWHQFLGGHEIPAPVLTALGAFLKLAVD